MVSLPPHQSVRRSKPLPAKAEAKKQISQGKPKGKQSRHVGHELVMSTHDDLDGEFETF
jgi:hypothetical protein